MGRLYVGEFPVEGVVLGRASREAALDKVDSETVKFVEKSDSVGDRERYSDALGALSQRGVVDYNVFFPR